MNEAFVRRRSKMALAQAAVSARAEPSAGDRQHDALARPASTRSCAWAMRSSGSGSSIGMRSAPSRRGGKVRGGLVLGAAGSRRCRAGGWSGWRRASARSRSPAAGRGWRRRRSPPRARRPRRRGRRCRRTTPRRCGARRRAPSGESPRPGRPRRARHDARPRRRRCARSLLRRTVPITVAPLQARELRRHRADAAEHAVDEDRRARRPGRRRRLRGGR